MYWWRHQTSDAVASEDGNDVIPNVPAERQVEDHVAAVIDICQVVSMLMAIKSFILTVEEPVQVLITILQIK